MTLDTAIAQPEGLEYAPETSTLPNRMFVSLMAYNGAPTVEDSPLAGRWATHTFDLSSAVLAAGYLDGVVLRASQAGTLGYFNYLPGSFWRVVCNVGTAEVPVIAFIWCRLEWLGDFDAAGFPIYNAATLGSNSTQLVQVNLGTGAGPGTGVTSFNTREGAVVPALGDYTVAQVTGAAPLASPTFTGAVTLAPKVNIPISANSPIGTVTLNGNTPVAVANTSITALSKVFLSRQDAPGGTGAFELVSTTVGVGFSVNATPGDTSTLAYLIIN